MPKISSKMPRIPGIGRDFAYDAKSNAGIFRLSLPAAERGRLMSIASPCSTAAAAAPPGDFFPPPPPPRFCFVPSDEGGRAAVASAPYDAAAAAAAAAAWSQGLTLVHFSAQPKPFWSHLPVYPCLIDWGGIMHLTQPTKCAYIELKSGRV